MTRWKDPATGRRYLICDRTGASYSTSSSGLAGHGPNLNDGAADNQEETSHVTQTDHALVDRSHLRRHKKRRDRERDTNLDHDEGMDEPECPEWIEHVMKVRSHSTR
jgi:hypothetical protein